MWKILSLMVLVFITAVAVFFWIKYYPLTKPDKINFESKSVRENPPGKVLADTAKNQVNNFFNQTKDSLQENSQNLINTVKEQTYNQAQNTVNTVFDKSNPTTSSTTVTVNILGVSNPPPDSITIDFSKDTNLKLNLKKGTKYHLQFKNIPSNYCLYIGDNKYKINDSELIELQFNSSGNYPIRLNLCEVSDKSLGEIVVQ